MFIKLDNPSYNYMNQTIIFGTFTTVYQFMTCCYFVDVIGG